MMFGGISPVEIFEETPEVSEEGKEEGASVSALMRTPWNVP
jgi:hypothetical protein